MDVFILDCGSYHLSVFQKLISCGGHSGTAEPAKVVPASGTGPGAMTGHSPGQTPIKSPDTKKPKVEVAVAELGMDPAYVPFDNRPTLIYGETMETDGTPIPTPKNLTSLFDDAAGAVPTPKTSQITVAAGTRFRAKLFQN